MQPEIKSILVNHDISSMTSADFVNRLDYEIIDSDCKKIYSDLEFNIKQNILPDLKVIVLLLIKPK